MLQFLIQRVVGGSDGYGDHRLDIDIPAIASIGAFYFGCASVEGGQGRFTILLTS